MSEHLKRVHATQKYAVDKGVAPVPQPLQEHVSKPGEEQRQMHNALTSLTELRNVHAKLHRANLQNVATKQRTYKAKEQARMWLDMGKLLLCACRDTGRQLATAMRARCAIEAAHWEPAMCWVRWLHTAPGLQPSMQPRACTRARGHAGPSPSPKKLHSLL